ncbi:MAG: hypothetical protein Q7R86_03140 [bacterium]|nr:hypothetical protein [bacterium]
MKNPEFLKQKYDLHNAEEVEAAASRTEKRTGEKLSQDPEERIQNYLDRLERLVIDPGKEQERKMFGAEPRPRALTLLREMVMEKYVRPNKQKMAEGAARVEERAAREMGVEAHYGPEELEQRGEVAVEDLEKSLDNWITYLSDANEPYPVWFRYYAFRNVLDMGDYDKDKKEFTKRSAGSTRLFPDIDRGALAYVEQMVEAAKDQGVLERLKKAQEAVQTPADQIITKEKAASFAKLSFSKQYVLGIRQAGEITPEMREETSGKWIRYEKGTDPTALWASLQNKGTAWCTKGFATAETQLKGGDFYVYYTLDRQGKPTIPRIAIRMQGDGIGEVRGVEDNQQNLEGNMVEAAEAKMNDLPGSERYRKASTDMKLLTGIEKKLTHGEKLQKNDLVFLYEINSPIEGFGYQKDPRILELRKQRNPEEDMPIVFECTHEQIVRKPEDINENTKAYVGKLEPGIFQKLPDNLEHIYTSFPEHKIRQERVGIGGKTAEQLINEMETAGINISGYAKDMLKSPEFTPDKNSEEATLIRLTVADLGFTGYTRTDQIYKRAEELGLELCPAEVGPHYRLKYQNQPLNEWIYVGMKQIGDSSGDPHVFELERRGDGLWLGDGWAFPTNKWLLGHGFVFRKSRVLER